MSFFILKFRPRCDELELLLIIIDELLSANRRLSIFMKISKNVNAIAKYCLLVNKCKTSKIIFRKISFF